MSHKVGILPQTSLGGLLSAYEQTSSVLKNAGGNILNDDILEEDYEDYDEKERNEIPEEGDEEEKGKNDVRLAEEAAKLGDLTLTELTSSVEVSEGMVELMINKEFPTAKKVTLTDCINTCVVDEDGGNEYAAGDWVEILLPDMKWRLAMVKRVVKQAPDDWNWNAPENAGQEPDWLYFYNAGLQRMLTVDQLRSPEQGLRAIFGARPFLFQQWALLKYESTVRFQEDHPADFTEMNAQEFAHNLFDAWIIDPRNSDLKKVVFDEAGGESKVVQEELLDHILKPFQLIDEMEEWEFEDEVSE